MFGTETQHRLTARVETGQIARSTFKEAKVPITTINRRQRRPAAVSSYNPQQWIQLTTPFQRKQIIATANVVVADKYLGHGIAASAF